MPITLPPDYFGNADPGFTGLVQGFRPAFAEIHDDAARASDALASADAGDVGVDLTNLDADSDTIATDTAHEHGAVTSAATDDVLRHYGTADGLTSTADQHAPAPDAPVLNPLFGTPPDQPPGLGDGVVALSDERRRARAEEHPSAPTVAPGPSSSPAPAAPPAVNGGAAVGAPPAPAPELSGTSDATAAGPDAPSSTTSSAPPAATDQHVTHAQLQDILSQLEATIVVMV